MPYEQEEIHYVGGHEVVIRKLAGFPEYRVKTGLDEFEVWWADGTDEEKIPGWYTEVGGIVEGPWDTKEDLFDEMFLGDEV